jgi:hypothetical protein
MRALPVFQTSGKTVYEILEKPQKWLFAINAFSSKYLKTSSFTLTMHKANGPLLVQSIQPKMVITLLPQPPFPLDLAPAVYYLFPRMKKPP